MSSLLFNVLLAVHVCIVLQDELFVYGFYDYFYPKESHPKVTNLYA